jgi:hypothetical protein
MCGNITMENCKASIDHPLNRWINNLEGGLKMGMDHIRAPLLQLFKAPRVTPLLYTAVLASYTINSQEVELVFQTSQLSLFGSVTHCLPSNLTLGFCSRL